MRIAVLGGSFDPPHIGHYLVVKQIAEVCQDIDKILLMPAYKHQWKPIQASGRDRLAMLSCFVDDKISVSDLEIRGKSGEYTIDTIRRLKNEIQADIYWIVGSDILAEWERWDKKEGILDIAKFLVFPREISPDPSLKKRGIILQERLPEGFESIADDQFITTNISSTIIRQRVKEGKSIRYMVPEEVEKYIKKKKLYI